VSKTFVRVAKKLFRFELYKFTNLQKLQEAGDVASVRFCNWFCELSNGFIDKLSLDPNEAWFVL